jgi:hypothetical protein
MHLKNYLISSAVFLYCGGLLFASSQTKTELGLFLDTFYAFDVNQPSNRERAYTTLPTRHNEFNVNLAYIEGKLSADRVRGRMALQTGTSVFTNYTSELRDPSATGGAQIRDLLMHLQEAYAGYRVSEKFWIDAGIYFSHIGSEGFISKDNWTYTRSLIADNSPYYQSGIRLSYDINPSWSAQLHVLNGWQNILETNNDKAIGTQIIFHPCDRFSLTHNIFLGRETALRFFQDLIIKYRMAKNWETNITLDLGIQGGSFWYGTSFMNRITLNEGTYLGLRLEYYSDKDGVIVPKVTSNGFQVWGASANLDVQLTSELLWRNEFKFLQSRDAVFPSSSGTSDLTSYVITSLALSL